MRIVRTLARTVGIGPGNAENRESTRQIVSPGTAAGEPQGFLERRIIELADGRPMEQILDTLYCEELRAGAWIADIGIWRNLYYGELLKTISRLALSGHIQLEPDCGGIDGQ